MRQNKYFIIFNLMENIKDNLILGIDFGTTNTVISYFNNNKANILTDGVFKSIKSKIAIKDGIYTCGNYITLNNDKIIHSFKTMIGTENMDTILLIFFDHLKKLIYRKFPNYNLKAVITVPSNFNDLQREIIRTNYINAGYDVIRVINEPSAAALAYGLSISGSEEEKILVLDLGGGTFDITLLLKDNGFFEVIHSVGLNDLGGNNFTQVIYNYIIKQNPNLDSSKLWFACQNAKEKLSWLDNYEIKVNDFSYNLNIRKFENLCNQLINRITEILNKIKEEYNDIKYIIMVGNSSKIPQIKTVVKSIFNITPWLHPNLESVVAEGACLYGAILENVYLTNEKVTLMDVLPLSLGVETVDGNFSIIIPKNTPLPIKRTQKYTTDMPTENSVKIKIYQGERLIAKKNTLIGEFIFDRISLGGTPQIDITFKVDTNSIITVIVTDKKSGVEKNILLKDIPKLNNDEIENIISLANSNNKVDEEEMNRCNRIYLLNTKIELAMNNIKLNNLIEDKNKNDLLEELYKIELQIQDADNIILLNLLKKMDEEFINWTQNNIESSNESNNTELEKIMIMELKDDLNNRIIYLLNKNPEYDEYLTPILEKISLTNISLEYLQDKLECIKELEDDEPTNYYEEYKNICLFIKTQLEENKIQLDNDKLEELINLVNNSILLIETHSEDTNWENELIIFNQKCENINND
jgi:molecular chaperone DnaK